MKNPSKSLLAWLTLIFLALACANPLETPAPQEEPANVETIVAATFSALTAAPSDGEPLPSTPEAGSAPSGLLPHPMLYLANDAAQVTQVYRLAVDGKSTTQLTFEPVNVEEFDVSPVDGSIVYVTNNQLFTVNADGNRAMIVDGGAKDPNNPLSTGISNPLWSPNGQTIAYGQKGINFYSIVSGQSNTALPAQLDSNGFGLTYLPINYAPDGGKLLISIVPIASDGYSNAIYYPEGNSVVELSSPNGGLTICCSINWTADGSAFYAGASFISPFTSSGLWRVNAANGQVETLLASDDIAETFNLAAAPFPAPDGQLYFIFGNQSGLNDFNVIVPLQMVRSATDGVTNRTILRPESFTTANGYLWAPDASFVLVTIPPTSDIVEGGMLQLFYTDGSPMISLIPFARSMKWAP